MNTPTHALLNLAALGAGAERPRVAAVLAGAVLPDLPMFGFWLWQSLISGRTQGEIWNRFYFDPGWQQFFDAFNSVPLYAVIAGLALWGRARPVFWIALSALLHIACDLPLHREDAHAHFWPITTWHYVSPVSYWDRSHYGFVFSLLELALLAGSAVWLARSTRRVWVRAALAGTVVGCALAWGLLSFWVDV